MQGHDIIVVGASAGGMEALQSLVQGLPPDLPAAVFVVWHIPTHSRGILPEVLARVTALPVAHARNREKIERGRIYVAPPDRHMLLENEHVRLTHGPKENYFRPAIDPLFRSAAIAYGSRVIGVILSGALDDGTSGLWTIKDRGGLAVVQDPDDALYASMPMSALEHVEIDERGPAIELGPVLAELARTPAQPGGRPVSKDQNIENMIAMEDNALKSGVMQLGSPTLYTCPECHGVLLQVNEGEPLRFRCHTGHAFTATTLAAHVTDAIEENLWSVVRAMDENQFLLRQMAEQLHASGDAGAAQRMLTQAATVERQTQTIREVALNHTISGSD